MPVIYKIQSPTNAVYIGQTNNLGQRLSSHKNGRYGLRKDNAVNCSIKEHGLDSHKIEVVQDLPKDVPKEVVDRFEQFYIDIYRDCGFLMMNIRDVSGKHAESTKKLISAANKGIKNGQKFGFRHSDESKKKMSMTRKGKKQPPESIEKRRLKLIGNTHTKGMYGKTGKRILQLSKENESIIKEWRSAKMAAIELKISKSCLYRCLWGEFKSAGGFKWKYV